MGRTVNQPKPRTITPSFASIRRTSRQRAIDLAGSVLAKPDQFLSAQELEEPRQRFSRMSLTALYDDYHAAWTPYKMEHGGKPPKAAFIQELVQAWKQLRKVW
jgi:hypothetical protein